MYSPKISEELIPDIYRMAKAVKKPMTEIVNEILRETIEKTRKENKSDERAGREEEQIHSSTNDT